MPSEICFLIPQSSILFRERDQLAVRSGSCRAARIGQQHERQQSRHLAIVREQIVNGSRQPDRLTGQLASLQIAVRRCWCSLR